MSSRSSIFSFDTLVGFPRPNRVFFLAFALLAGIGFLISWNRVYLESISPRSLLTPISSFLRNQYTGRAKIIFLGSSRFVSCIKTDTFAQLGNIDPSSVLNLSMDSGSFWEALVLCRENPSLLESASLAVINIEPWMFNRNLLHPVYAKPHEFEPHFYTWAEFREKMEIPDWKTRAGLLLDLLWPLSEKRNFVDWCRGVSAMAHAAPPPAYLITPTYHYSETALRARLNDPRFHPQVITAYHLHDYTFSEQKADYLRRLVQILREKGIRVLLVQPPMHRVYMAAIYQQPDYLAEYRKMLSYIHAMESAQIRSIIWETPEDCGLDETVFIDYGHFNLVGARLFTEKLYLEMKQLGVTGADETSR
ncbi:MAG: hypothetical protein ACOZF0_05655 [Thermodesulfobacteriota bacterium]